MGNVQCSLYGFWNRRSWGWQNCWGNTLSPRIWYGRADSDDTSQHLLDPYSLDHCTSGVLQYMLIPPFGPGQYCVIESLRFPDWEHSFPWQWFVFNVTIHFLWEIFENTPCCIYYLRNTGVDPVYVGDSVINTVADIGLNALGYVLTWLLVEYIGWWTSIILFVVLQVVSYFMGSGFFMIAYRLFKSFCCPDPDPENEEKEATEPREDEPLVEL